MIIFFFSLKREYIWTKEWGIAHQTHPQKFTKFNPIIVAIKSQSLFASLAHTLLYTMNGRFLKRLKCLHKRVYRCTRTIHNWTLKSSCKILLYFSTAYTILLNILTAHAEQILSATEAARLSISKSPSKRLRHDISSPRSMYKTILKMPNKFLSAWVLFCSVCDAKKYKISKLGI